MSVSRRCSICALNWPDILDYKECPVCLDSDGTDRCRDTTPMDDAEAISLKLHAEFDRFYEEWDASHSPARLRSKKNAPASV